MRYIYSIFLLISFLDYKQENLLTQSTKPSILYRAKLDIKY